MTANPSAAVKALLDQLMRQGALPGLPLVTIGGPTVVAGGGNAAPSMSVSNAAPLCLCQDQVSQLYNLELQYPQLRLPAQKEQGTHNKP